MEKPIIIPNLQNEITKDELLEKLKELRVEESEYSLSGDFNPDTIVLWHNYYKWEVFYMDERGSKKLLKTAYSENEAYYCIYKLFKDIKS
ncbi:MAG: hypothetical protein E6772_11545 [Dysgonomonas sp.]|nr:hypothetical protein [Dysgonomonas sp.]